MYRSKKQRIEICEIRSYRSRQRLCREIFIAMTEMVRWRKEGKLENLIKVAENELGLRFRVFSNRLIPRKNEFIVQICNYIAMSHIDMLVNPPQQLLTGAKNSSIERRKSSNMDEYERLGQLFGLHTTSTNALAHYVFGDQSTYRDPMDVELDNEFTTFKNSTLLLKDRLRQTPMLDIEKCHIYYELGRTHLKQSLYDETKFYARHVVQIAEQFKHSIWKLLGYILVVRAEIMQKYLARLVESLEKVLKELDDIDIDGLKSIILEAIEV
jgi:hypothetical protein